MIFIAIIFIQTRETRAQCLCSARSLYVTLPRYSPFRPPFSALREYRGSSIIPMSATTTDDDERETLSRMPVFPSAVLSALRNRLTDILTVRRPASSVSRCISTFVAHGAGHPRSCLLVRVSCYRCLQCITRKSRRMRRLNVYAFNSAACGTGSVDSVQASVVRVQSVRLLG